MLYRRAITEQLLAWLQKRPRLPLVVFGARQVGKTSLITQFCELKFQRIHQINFESDPHLADLFSGSLDPKQILNRLSIIRKATISEIDDVLFLDEIQLCPRALTSLKYFAEKLPNFAVVAAGSLLGLTLTNEAYPVGKVEHLTLNPMNFAEFLEASGNQALLDFIYNYQLGQPYDQTLHQLGTTQFRRYLFSGGMPAVVREFLKHDDPDFLILQNTRKLQNELIAQYINDFAKHAGKANALHLENTFKGVARQLGGTIEGSVKRFKFSGVVPGISQYSRLSNSFDWLEKTGLIIKAHLPNHIEVPLDAYIKGSIFKAFIFDIGLLGAILDSPIQLVIDNKLGSYRGYMLENFIAQELNAYAYRLYSWSTGQTEVEFLIQTSNGIIPIEVKAGRTSKAKSLSEYIRRFDPQKAFILGDTLPRVDHNTYRLPWYFTVAAKNLF